MSDAYPSYKPLLGEGVQGCKKETIRVCILRTSVIIWNVTFGHPAYDLTRCNEIRHEIRNWLAEEVKKYPDISTTPWKIRLKSVSDEVERCRNSPLLKDFWLKVVEELFSEYYDENTFEVIMNLKARDNATPDGMQKDKDRMKNDLMELMNSPMKKRRKQPIQRQPISPDQPEVVPALPPVSRQVLVFEWETVKSRFMQIMFCIVYSACNLEQDSASLIYDWVLTNCRDIIISLDNVKAEVQEKLHSLQLTETDRCRRAEAEQCIMKDTCMFFSLWVLKDAAKELAVRLYEERCEVLAELLSFSIEKSESEEKTTKEKKMLFEDVRHFINISSQRATKPPSLDSDKQIWDFAEEDKSSFPEDEEETSTLDTSTKPTPCTEFLELDWDT